MRNHSKLFALTFLILFVLVDAFGESARAQRTARGEFTPPRSMYQLNFTLHVVEDGQDNVRQFTLILEERTSGKLRALTRIPVRQTADQITYVETGIKCDAEYQEIEGRVRLEVETHFSDVAPAGSQPADAPQIQEWQSRVGMSLVPSETTLLSAYDGGENQRRYTLEVRAEKLR